MASFQFITQGDYQSLAEFRHQIRRFLHFSEQAARGAGLEPQQHQLLLALKVWKARRRPSESWPNGCKCSITVQLSWSTGWWSAGW
ncbi:MAG TPA: hypothetical protein VJN43_06940 [Bryobacteraceae bacterium]|nr:hypothetical protein [Bryobacteraceae bacterium]